MQRDVTCSTSAVIYMLKIPPTQEKRRRASVGAVVKKTGFGKVNVGSILANMMVKFHVYVVIQCHHVPNQLAPTSLVSISGHFTNMARKERNGKLF